MQDIGEALNTIMQEKQCSPVYAFFLLSESQREGGKDGLRELQSKSEKKISRRLRYKGDF